MCIRDRYQRRVRETTDFCLKFFFHYHTKHTNFFKTSPSNKMADKKKLAVEAKEKGNKFFGQKDYKSAIEQYTKAIEYDPSEYTFYTNRAAAYQGLNDWQTALSDANKSVELKPDWSKGWYRKGLSHKALNNWDEAFFAFHSANKYDPSSDVIKAALTEADTERRKPKTVGPDGKPLSKAQILKEQGNFYFKEGQFAKAVECYTKGLEVTTEPKDRCLLLGNRAACRLQQECQDYNAVICDCSEALEIEPNNAKLLTRRGQAYEALEKYKHALQDMRQAFSLDPTNQRAGNAISRISTALKKLGQ
eukprot:TRINITY_DN636_c0_g1_i4.p1 TRINITY_DN636_c0_g1~~TRINITY_DN636_c0_g1_i4.p1  ORF type:complete len:305 (-),score=118.69 TRINITY_DN636_c0_g1_i4:177-1091(-)